MNYLNVSGKTFVHSYTTAAVSHHTANLLSFVEVISLHKSGFHRCVSEIVTIKSLSGLCSDLQYFSLMVSWLFCAYLDTHLLHSFYAAVLHQLMTSSSLHYHRPFLYRVFPPSLIFLCPLLSVYQSLPLVVSLLSRTG